MATLVCELAGKFSLLSESDYSEEIHGKIVGQLASPGKARELFQRLSGFCEKRKSSGAKRGPRKLDIAALNALVESLK